MNTMEVAQVGYDAWAAKPHNKKWVKMIYHTPIPNDLVVCIAMAFSEAMKPPNPRRCETNDVGTAGECLACQADQGEACKLPRRADGGANIVMVHKDIQA